MLILPCQLSRGRVRRASASSHATSMRSELGRAKVGSALRHEGLWWCVGEIPAKLVATIIYSSPSSLTRQHSSHQNPIREFFTQSSQLTSSYPLSPIPQPRSDHSKWVSHSSSPPSLPHWHSACPPKFSTRKNIEGCPGGDGGNACPGGDYHV